jgi:hypothetical protein
MFSGGRDSTLAAMRLMQQGVSLTLVTITSDHLHGIEAVKRRLAEFKSKLPENTEWILIKQPTELHTDTSFYKQTCLSCHHAYVVVAGVVAKALGIFNLAFGYAGYQNSWPEQTPLAVSRLSQVLSESGISLLLPVYDLSSRSMTDAELISLGLSHEALEQKCSRQVSNIALNDADLRQQIDLWESAIRESIAKIGLIDASIIERIKLGEVSLHAY